MKKFLAFWGFGVFVNQAAGVTLGKTTVVDHGRASVRIDAEAHHHVIQHQSGRTMRITVGHTGMGGESPSDMELRDLFGRLASADPVHVPKTVTHNGRSYKLEWYGPGRAGLERFKGMVRPCMDKSKAVDECWKGALAAHKEPYDMCDAVIAKLCECQPDTHACDEWLRRDDSADVIAEAEIADAEARARAQEKAQAKAQAKAQHGSGDTEEADEAAEGDDVDHGEHGEHQHHREHDQHGSGRKDAGHHHAQINDNNHDDHHDDHDHNDHHDDHDHNDHHNHSHGGHGNDGVDDDADYNVGGRFMDTAPAQNKAEALIDEEVHLEEQEARELAKDDEFPKHVMQPLHPHGVEPSVVERAEEVQGWHPVEATMECKFCLLASEAVAGSAPGHGHGHGHGDKQRGKGATDDGPLVPLGDWEKQTRAGMPLMCARANKIELPGLSVPGDATNAAADGHRKGTAGRHGGGGKHHKGRHDESSVDAVAVKRYGAKQLEKLCLAMGRAAIDQYASFHGTLRPEVRGGVVHVTPESLHAWFTRPNVRRFCESSCSNVDAQLRAIGL
eukprot:TRINITY_DN310_c1_g1_i2.p1 TRINITY_DN310_c1_g1~~TRINITY_DN310_c1_g1_i2.p1  ORF type:complete len:559 (-),score=165.13 TRINITY_DN310_c1_g1_i2:80-1756(-)